MKCPSLRLNLATIEDVDDIIEINNSFIEYTTNKGLILSKLESDQLKNNIFSNPDYISVAITSDDTIAGFIELSFSVDVDVIKKLEWFDENLRTKFENGKKLYIEKVAVKSNYQRQNVGKFMYEAIFEKYPEHIFYSFIVKKPFDNIVSLNFHKKLGFIETAKFKVDEFLGLKNYESVMLMKFLE
ncbi:MAG: GNAT family N-acetyltransferase [Thermodesulfobacteriota bacterium]|nr:GNAT family N-acetyltransferase [Thermodesulfobacteriota bacterium]